MKRPSFSSVAMLGLCPPSHVLPRVQSDGEASQEGREGHAVLEAMVNRGDVVPASIPTKGERLAEASFVYDVSAGTSRFLGCGLGRNYGPLSPNELPGTIDLLAVYPDFLAVWEWKFVDSWIVPPAKHRQLRSQALAAARHYGKERVLVGWTKLDRSALPELEVTYQDSAELDSFDLDCEADELRSDYERMARARKAWEGGEHPDVFEGPHCRYCESRKFCGAKTGLVRAAVSQPVSFVDAVRDLAPEQIGDAYQRANAAMSQLHALKAEIEALARETPIPLPDGRVLQLVEGREVERVVDARKVAEFLAENFGADVALKACDLDASKASIERALREFHQGPALKTVLSALRDMGAVGKVQSEPRVSAVSPERKDRGAA